MNFKTFLSENPFIGFAIGLVLANIIYFGLIYLLAIVYHFFLFRVVTIKDQLSRTRGAQK